MTIMRKYPGLIVAMAAVAFMGLGGCGGGGAGSSGGGGGGGGDGDPLIVAIRLLNVPTANGFETLELWSSSSSAGPPNPPAEIPLNVAVEMEFAGNVDQGSVPQSGIALGTINITTTDGTITTPAAGSFGVSDLPSLPPGNGRLVTFLPTPPTDPLNPATTAGLGGAIPYTIFIPRAGNSTQVLTVAGESLTNEAVAAFQTCDPAGAGGVEACFTDPIPGPPFVVATTPDTNDPTPPAIDPTNVTNDTVTVFVSEPLFPGAINLTNYKLINSASQAQVPGSVQFYQAGTPEAGPNTARIDYIASSQLLANVQYEIQITNEIKDFGQNPVVLYDPSSPSSPPSGQRFFLTIPVPFCPQPPITDTFDSTANRDTVTGIAIWDGSGSINSTFPFNLTGGGGFGDLNLAPGPQSLDTGAPTTTGFADGNWDVLNFIVQAGSTVRAQGPFRIHIRCLGLADISGSIDGNAGMNSTAPLGNPNQGPGNGAFNNGGNAANSVVKAGVGGVGGGGGGRASQTGYTARTFKGEAGFGPTENGMPNTGPFGANETFGGGVGGDGGFRFPAGGVQGDLGGLGGAGGSAWAQGQDGRPRSSPATGCVNNTPLNQSISMASPIPPAMVLPIMVASAGSGGGGGGDRHEVSGATNDDQGGGGAGGGGGFRVSAVDTVTINSGAQLFFNGGSGGMGNLFFGGAGAGGSGGEIWLQSFLSVVIAPTAQMNVQPGAANNTCSDHSSGTGGFGLYQFEQPGMTGPNTSFLPSGGGTGGANISVVEFPFDAQTVGGTATSIFFDTGYGDPDYDPATVMEQTSVGTNPPSPVLVVVEYQGAFEALAGGTPNLSNISPWVTGPNIDQIDGYRYVRFRIRMEIPTPNTMGTGTLPTNSLPTVDIVSFGYSAPINCPQ